MLDFLSRLLDTSDFPARWHCGRWTDAHGWLHIVSDMAIFGAYVAIPTVLVIFIVKRDSVPYHRVFWLFAAFIAFCGSGHLLEAIIFWAPVYRLSGVVKLGTALASWSTVGALVLVLPKALALRSPESLEEEVAERTRELELANAELERARALFEMTIEASPSGMLVVDEAGEIVLVNGEAERLFGYAREELLGEQIEMLVPDDVRGSHPELRKGFQRDPAARAMGTGRSLYAQRKDGTTFPVEVGLNPIETSDGLRVLSAVVDRTEVVSQRERLEAHAAELERSNKELEQFAYVASHDLQQPLRMVASYTALLEKRYKGQLDERADKYIHYAVDGALRMKRLLNDLLELSRVGRKGAPFDEVDLAAVVADSRQLLHPTAEEAAFEISELPTVQGDHTQLVRVFQNVIGNALKYRGEEPPRIRIHAEKQAGMWCVQIQDNGIGFEPEHAERIFDMFRRLHGPDEYEGTGIGLAIVAKIIERHGGRAWAESRSGNGTTVSFTLPSDCE